jgi:hypothetical protein
MLLFDIQFACIGSEGQPSFFSCKGTEWKEALVQSYQLELRVRDEMCSGIIGHNTITRFTSELCSLTNSYVEFQEGIEIAS